MNQTQSYICLVPFALAAFIGISLNGCGDSDDDTGLCAQNADANRDSYPQGPYGKSEEDIIENLSFINADGDTVTLNDTFKNTNTRLLILTSAAEWCSACIEEQPELQSLYETHADEGLEIIVALFEKTIPGGEAADIETISEWVGTHQVTFPVLADTDKAIDTYLDDGAAHPVNILIDVAKMSIIRKSSGFDSSAVQGVIDACLQ